MDSKNFTLIGWVSTMSRMEMGLFQMATLPCVFTELPADFSTMTAKARKAYCAFLESMSPN